MPDDPIAAAAKIYIEARLGEKYLIVGLGEGDDPNLIEIDVQEKGKTRTKIETVVTTAIALEKIISENLTVDHLTGKKPMPETVRADIMDQFGSGIDDLFEGRE